MMLKYKGFSLIELMIVIAIIGILAAIAVPSYRNYILKAHVAELMDVGSSLEIVVNEYVQEQGQATTSGSGTPTCTNINYNAPQASTNLSSATISTTNCVVTVNGSSTAGSTTITLTPTLQSDGSISWKCSSGGSKFAPSTCQ